MNFTINEVDQVIERTGCSYQEAKDALVKADGDVIDAIILLESNQRCKENTRYSTFFEESERDADSILNKVKEAIEQGNVNKIAIRDRDGRTVTSVSVNTGAAIGTIALFAGAAPMAVISALIAKFGLNYQFVIIRSEGSDTVL